MQDSRVFVLWQKQQGGWRVARGAGLKRESSIWRAKREENATQAWAHVQPCSPPLVFRAPLIGTTMRSKLTNRKLKNPVPQPPLCKTDGTRLTGHRVLSSQPPQTSHQPSRFHVPVDLVLVRRDPGQPRRPPARCAEPGPRAGPAHRRPARGLDRRDRLGGLARVVGEGDGHRER